MVEYSLSTLHEFVGQELGVSDWLTIDQPLIDQFAASTHDDQWIHTDVERAARESSFGMTIAHGFLILSLIPYLRRGITFIPDGIDEVINYGLDYLRFLQPVRSGSRIRLRLMLSAVEPRSDNRLLLKSRNTIEIENNAQFALVADVLTLIGLKPQSKG